MVDRVDKQDLILEYVKKSGPVLPIEIGKYVKCDSLIASALLSGLASMNQLKVSKMKIGGSPLYFAPGQEEMLQNFAEKLGMGEKSVYNVLKSRKILMDKQLNPLQKEALQRLKDFAVMLEVEMPGKGIKETFWKWYLLSDAETTALIKEIMMKAYATKPEKPKPAKAESQKISAPEQQGVKETKETRAPKEAVEKDLKKEKNIAEPLGAEGAGVEDAGKKELKKKEKPKKEVKRKILRKKELEEKPDEEKKSTKFKIEEELLKIQEEEKKTLKKEKPKTPAMLEKEQKTTGFMQRIEAHFKKNEIVIVDTEIIRPNEIDFVIKVPSAVGKISYYCKAKDKKSVNEGDLSTAFVQGQLKKLPVLFLSSGKLTKRAEEMIEKQFQHMNIVTLDE